MKDKLVLEELWGKNILETVGKISMKKLLITGASGFLGLVVVNLAAQQPDLDIYAVTTGRKRVIFPENVHVIKADLLDRTHCEILMESIRPDLMFHFAWNNLENEDSYTSGINIEWLKVSLYLLDLFAKNKGERFVFSGSWYEYGYGNGIYREDSPACPKNFYGASKLSFTNIASIMCEQHDISFVSARFFSIYGENDARIKAAIPYTINSIGHGQPIICKSPHNEWDFIHVDDAARAAMAIMNSDYCGIVNVGSGLPHKIRSVLTAIAEKMECHYLLSIKEDNKNAETVVADTSILNNVIGYRCRVPLDDGIERTINWWFQQEIQTYEPIYEPIIVRDYNKAVKPLLDIDVLNERIKKVKYLAESDAVSEKKFYIISRDANLAGFFSYVFTHFLDIIYALAKGMIPVIDMQNYANPYLEQDKLGIENSWEYFFKQPCGYSLNDADNFKCVYSEPRFLNYRPRILPILIYNDQLFEDERFHLWTAIFREFFQLSYSATQYIEEEYNRIIKPDMRVIGVFCRGTDFTNSRPTGHPIQPEVDEIIHKVKSVIREWNCDYVYITADERKTVKRFENAFPGRVLSVSRMYYDELDIDYGRQLIATAKFSRDNDAYLRGLEYLSSVIILSRCNSAVLGLTNGSMAAMYINGGKFENTYIFNLGFY